MINSTTDILIIGGGLAGLTAALHLQRGGLEVILVEKQAYPFHRVCGEYVSNEVLPYLQWLGADPLSCHPEIITRMQFSAQSGKSVMAELPLGGFGLSRFRLDELLYQLFVARGGQVIRDKVTGLSQQGKGFLAHTLEGRQLSAVHVIGAWGKRSRLDHQLNRKFIQRRSPVLAVKGHYSGTFPCGLVALHHFRGGYCGVSKIEDGKLNICYLADYASFRSYKNSRRYEQEVLCRNPQLEQVFAHAVPLFEQPLTISQLSFGTRQAVTDHVLLAGDSAGLIHPLCGNGMGMAIHSAKLCAELLLALFSGEIRDSAQLEGLYTKAWKENFSQRMTMGGLLAAVLRREKLTRLVMAGLVFMPAVLPALIRRTHGKPLKISA